MTTHFTMPNIEGTDPDGRVKLTVIASAGGIEFGLAQPGACFLKYAFALNVENVDRLRQLIAEHDRIRGSES
jgi:hypothetical protein